MKIECIDIKRNDPDFMAFAEALTIVNVEGLRLRNIIQNGSILKVQKLQNTYTPGCYEKVYRSNLKIFLAQASMACKYPDFSSILTLDGYRNVFEFELYGFPGPQFLKLARLPEQINIDFKYFSMLRGKFAVWFKDATSAVIFKSPSSDIIFAIMPVNMELA